MIPSELIEEVRRGVDAAALIGARVQLRRSGSSLVGRCPFHADREASFRVYPDGKRYVCFGCGAQGDVFDFFRRADGKPFAAVVRELARSAHVELPEREVPSTDADQRRERGALLAACEAAAAHWQARLQGSLGEPARAYLAGRGVARELVSSFRIGYALPDWHDLQRALHGRRFSTALQLSAGLLAAREVAGAAPRAYDRFRQRVVFPVEDLQGRVIGFGGRVIGEEAGARYINTPETPLYKKSHALHGLRQAREAIQRTGHAILVEGYFDVLALHQAGFPGAVAPCGTVVTRQQVELLAQAGCRELVLLFDGDEAGARAPVMAATVLLQSGLATAVARCPRSQEAKVDPAALFQRRGAGALREALAGAVPLTEHLIDEVVREHAGGEGPKASVEEKLRVVAELVPHVVATPEGLPRSTFERAIARRLDVNVGVLRREVERTAGRPLFGRG